MRKITIYLTCFLIASSCTPSNHYHDGNYHTSTYLYDVNIQVDGGYITVENSATGLSRLKCTQYNDRIEYTEDDETTRILTVMQDSSLKLSDKIIFKKIN